VRHLDTENCIWRKRPAKSLFAVIRAADCCGDKLRFHHLKGRLFLLVVAPVISCQNNPTSQMKIPNKEIKNSTQ